MLTDDALMRYSRQILINDFDVAGQERLGAATVLVVGLGGLGSPVALYLAAAGVGQLVLADGDNVELSNLQRQIAHSEASVGLNKARSAASAIAALNPGVSVRLIEEHLEESSLLAELAGVDVVVDASDNYTIRFALNRACMVAGVPLVSAAAVRAEGQVAVFDPVRGGPCYRCLYPDTTHSAALNCSQSGVMAPLVGVIGSLQAMEAIKVITGYGESLTGRLLVMDLRSAQVHTLDVPLREDCPDCAPLRRN